MSKATFATLVAQMENDIRSGDKLVARRKLRAVSPRRVPRPQRILLAALARRAEVPALGISVLAPVVRPASGKSDASDAEKSEYAACLVRLGAETEALTLLDTVDAKRHPGALLYRAFALVNEWEYARTIPLLEQFIATGSDDYLKLVARVNLAAALVFERRHGDAARIIAALTGETAQLPLVHHNALELAAQNLIFQGDWAAAKAALKKVEEFAKKTGGVDALLIRKWGALLRLLRDGASPITLAEWQEVRAEAKARGLWETVRTCDRFRASSTKDAALWLKLYFGTPYSEFRKKLVAEFPSPPPLPPSYAWYPGGEATAKHSIDLGTGELDGRPALRPGMLQHRLVFVLASDFYRPLRTASIHARIYPRDYFSPSSSPARVRQALATLRRWLAARHLSIAIEETDGTYRFSGKGVAFQVPLTGAPDDLESARLVELRGRLGAAPFGAAEVARALGVPLRSAQRLLQKGVERGGVTRSGSGNAVKYQFVTISKG